VAYRGDWLISSEAASLDDEVSTGSGSDRVNAFEKSELETRNFHEAEASLLSLTVAALPPDTAVSLWLTVVLVD